MKYEMNANLKTRAARPLCLHFPYLEKSRENEISFEYKEQGGNPDKGCQDPRFALKFPTKSGGELDSSCN